MYRPSIALLTIILAVSASSNSIAQPPASWQVSKVLHVGGEGGWDYITCDSENKLLFVPRVTHTMVLNAETGEKVADIPGQKHNHGVALVPKLGRGFISDGDDASVTIFDSKSYRVLGKVKADADADGIVYDPESNKVLVVCGDAGSLIPIPADVDPQSGTADPAIARGGKPEFFTVTGGKVYVNLVDKNKVAVVDLKTSKVLNRWPTVPGGSPVGMAIDTQQRLLFVGCRKPQKMVVLSADDGKVIADLPIGAGVDATQILDGDAFASCRDGTLAVARKNASGTFEIVQNVATRPGARTMAVDPKTHSIYLPTADFGSRKDGRGRPTAKPGTFMIVVVRPAKS